jgi:hypothetical protein
MPNNESLEWIGRYTQEQIISGAEEGFVAQLGSIYSGSASAYEQKKRLEDDVDDLLDIFGVDLKKWQSRIVAGGATITSQLGATGYREHAIADLNHLARGKRLGEFIIARSYWAVPIESDDIKTGEFKLTLALDEHVHARFVSFGEQEVERSYIDLETREELKGSVRELDAKVTKGEAETAIDTINTNIRYSVDFSNPARL